jgi:hypothetical protein
MQTTAAHRPEPALLDDDGIGDWLYNELMEWFGPEDDPFSLELAGSVGGRLNACRSARPLTVVPLFQGVSSPPGATPKTSAGRSVSLIRLSPTPKSPASSASTATPWASTAAPTARSSARRPTRNAVMPGLATEAQRTQRRQKKGRASADARTRAHSRGVCAWASREMQTDFSDTRTGC